MQSDQFEWDKGNIKKSSVKHGIHPVEAMTAFSDRQAIILYDEKHSNLEKRYIRLAKSLVNRILVIAYTRRNGKYRIISSRKANKKEIIIYNQQ